jgi:hypothetical protein
MTDRMSRREVLKVMGAAGAGALLPGVAAPALPDEPPAATAAPAPVAEVVPAGTDILPLTSTSEVFIPPRGRAFDKFSFDFPEPSFTCNGLRFGFIVFTRENAYSLDAGRMRVTTTDHGCRLVCDGFAWAGGQVRADGRLQAEFRVSGGETEWDVTVEMDQPVKSVTTIIRGVPRGGISASGGEFFDPRDDEILFGYPFSGGDLFGPGAAGGLSTPLVIVRQSDTEFLSLSSLDDRVRAKRFFFQPGDASYRVEAVFEGEGWLSQNRLRVPTWRLGRTATAEAAVARHYEHIRSAYRIPEWEARPDVPDWLRRTALVTTLHGQHYSGYVFNDYARMLEILRWMATQISPERVLVFLSSWDGRYYWDYPRYTVSERMGGEAGFRALVRQGQQLGFRIMPMFGANAANRRQPGYAHIANAATEKIDGDRTDLNWVDWDNDRHQEGWLSYMNLGVESWRRALTDRIADMIERFGVDAYFLDIVAGWINNPVADMHEGTRLMVAELRARYPKVLCCGEFHYDALMEFIPLYHSMGGRYARPHLQRSARWFQHLSHPAPGRGSSGVHESGFGRFDPQTLSLRDDAIPTLQVVDDTFSAHRDVMAAIIAKAKERAKL